MFLVFGSKKHLLAAMIVVLAFCFAACENTVEEKIKYVDKIVYVDDPPVYPIAFVITDMTAEEIADAVAERIAATMAQHADAPNGSAFNSPITLRPDGIALDDYEALTAMFTAIKEYWVHLDLSDLEGDTWAYNADVAAVYKGKVLSLTFGEGLTEVLDGTGYDYGPFNGFLGMRVFKAENLTSLGNYAFYACGALESISLPKLETIGLGVFGYCYGLSNVDLPLLETIKDGTNNSSGTFYRCYSLESISLPKAETIGWYAFSGCSALKNVDLPQAGTIQRGAFYQCGALLNVNMPLVTEIVGFNALSGAFYQCGALENISLPKVEKLGAYTFSPGCNALKNVDLPKAETIGNNAFDSCSSLTSISLPEAETIGASAFQYCSSLATVELPKADMIGATAFRECSSLTGISLPKAETIGNNAFYNCTALATVELPKADMIGATAFRGCTALEALVIPLVTVLNNQVFYDTGTQALSITMGPNAPTVGISTFQDVVVSKTVTVKVPASAMGYGSVPATYDTDTTTACWGNGFRGGGWNDSGLGNGTVNASITLIITN